MSLNRAVPAPGLLPQVAAPPTPAESPRPIVDPVMAYLVEEVSKKSAALEKCTQFAMSWKLRCEKIHGALGAAEKAAAAAQERERAAREREAAAARQASRARASTLERERASEAHQAAERAFAQERERALAAESAQQAERAAAAERAVAGGLERASALDAEIRAARAAHMELEVSLEDVRGALATTTSALEDSDAERAAANATIVRLTADIAALQRASAIQQQPTESSSGYACNSVGEATKGDSPPRTDASYVQVRLGGHTPQHQCDIYATSMAREGGGHDEVRTGRL